MNEAQKRRKKLLDYTRSLYSEGGAVPAVHPRYRNTYDRLYREDEDIVKSSFGIRAMLSILLLAGYAAIDYSGRCIFDLNSTQIMQEILKNNLLLK